MNDNEANNEMPVVAIEDLSKPIRDDEVEWRVLRKGEKNGRVWAHLAPYVDSRAIQKRLDKCCGAANWQNRVATVGIPTLQGKKAEDTGTSGGFGMTVGIGIRIGGDWIWKWDGADFSRGMEITKSAISDGLKRAACLWGIGRDLYDLPMTFAQRVEKGRAPKDIDPRRVVTFRQGSDYYWALAPLLGAIGAPSLHPKNPPAQTSGERPKAQQEPAGAAEQGEEPQLVTPPAPKPATDQQRAAIQRLVEAKKLNEGEALDVFARLESMPTFHEAGNIIQELSDR